MGENEKLPLGVKVLVGCVYFFWVVMVLVAAAYGTGLFPPPLACTRWGLNIAECLIVSLAYMAAHFWLEARRSLWLWEWREVALCLLVSLPFAFGAAAVGARAYLWCHDDIVWLYGIGGVLFAVLHRFYMNAW